ncbi:MAG: hypothetical protein LBS94_05480, partial [Prevotellaceae bacterium]|nr:hypothetical protein [Prevotellaceae bacterium]
MMRKLPYLLALPSLLVLLAVADAPVSTRELLLRLFAKQETFFAHEKVYLHTDKPYYMAGDTVWFAGYVTSAITHRPSGISNILYVDLISSSARVISRQKWKVENGFTRGQLGLAEDLPQDAYTLRAYTAWMCNFDSSYLFTKPLSVFQVAPDEDTIVSPLPRQPDVSLRFFPEGGQLVEGLPARVAFEVRDEQGNPLAVRATLKSAGYEADAVASNFAGYGSFVFVPQKDSAPHLTLAHKGSTYAFPLPAAQRSGVVMRCSHASAEKIRVAVSGKFDDPRRAKSMLLVGHVRGQLSFMVPMSLNEQGVAVAKILTEACPQGILCLTLIDGAGTPCAERLMYVDKGERVSVKLSAYSLQKDGKATTIARIATTDQGGKPVSAHVSLTALNENTLVLPDSTEENIGSYLLLSSDLRGKILQPSYYFSEAPGAAADLDLLLLTQGWRRFEVNPAMVDSLPTITYPVEKRLLIAGKVKNINKEKAKDYRISMYTYGADNRMREFISHNLDSSGGFVVLFGDIYGELTSRIFTYNQRNKLRSVKVAFADAPQPFVAPLAQVPDMGAIAKGNQKLIDQRTYLADLQRSSDKHVELQDVVVKGRRTDHVDGYSLRGTPPDFVFTGKELMEYGTEMGAIQINVPDFRLTTNDFGEEYFAYGRETPQMHS